MADNSPALPIAIEELHYHYGSGAPVLEGLSLRVAAGERLGILGPSGAGKSTLLLHLNGVLRARRGRVAIGDWEITDRTVGEVRREVGIVFQNPDDQLFHLTVEEDIAFGPENLGLSRSEVRERVEKTAESLRIADCLHRHPQQLSFGQRRRAAIATVLAMEPRVVALDEPFANLDPAMSEQVIELIHAMPATVVLISQSIFPALKCCDRLAVLGERRIIADGPAFEIARNRDLLRQNGLDFYFYEDIWRRLA